MTAVEYILNLVVGTGEQGKDVRVKDTISKSEIKQAKEMEKEQIKGAYIAGGYNNTDREAEIFYMEYYNETFKSE